VREQRALAEEGGTAGGRDAAPPAPPDDALVRAAQAGDAAAFGRLYERYFEQIYVYAAVRLGREADAEDVAGQVFLRALEALGGYRWRGVPFRAWLFRIARNLLVDARRRAARRPTVPLDAVAGVVLADERAADPERRALDRATWHELAAAVAQLTAAQQQVLALRFGADLPTAEVARVLGRSEASVKALQHAGLRALQRRHAAGAPR
jgi:RNA polymerase sigma-70 factor, ECF subfamily